MRKLTLFLLCSALSGAALWWLLPSAPQLPAAFEKVLPAGCRQVLLVQSPSPSAVQVILWRLSRDGDAPWQVEAGPLPATLGRKGLAWGLGLHEAAAPSGFPVKVEGDKCSPAGVFALPFTFGIAAQAADLHMPYVPLTDSVIGVDDPLSKHYNQVVDSQKVERDWNSHEPMKRWGDLYAWGAFIGHNPRCEPGKGSCIFLHRWPAPGVGTAGCTALSTEDLEQTIKWLDATKLPHLVQALVEWK